MDHISVAEHLFRSTYPVIKDPKLLYSIIKHLLEAIEEKLEQSLKSAREAKEIGAYSTTLTGKITAYRLHLANKKGITPIDFMLISELQEIVADHDEASMAFRRKTSFMIADEEYNMHELSEEKVKTYITRTKSLLSRA